MDSKYNFSMDQNIRLIFTRQKFSASTSLHCAVENEQSVVFASSCFCDPVSGKGQPMQCHWSMYESITFIQCFIFYVIDMNI